MHLRAALNVSDVCLSGLTQTRKSAELCSQTFLELFNRASRRQGGTMKPVGLFNRLTNYWWRWQCPHYRAPGLSRLAATSLFLVSSFCITPCIISNKTIEGVHGLRHSTLRCNSMCALVLSPLPRCVSLVAALLSQAGAEVLQTLSERLLHGHGVKERQG